MNTIWIFLSGLGFTVVVCFLVVGYLRPHLQRILVDLCHTEERAKFWTAFSNVTLILTPIVFALYGYPLEEKGMPIFFQIATQFKWALIGLVGSVVMLGIVIGRFIPKEPLAVGNKK